MKNDKLCESIFEQGNFRHRLDDELCGLELTETGKKRIAAAIKDERKIYRKPRITLRAAAVCTLIFIFSCTAVFAAYTAIGKLSVNGESLPPLAEMEIKSIDKIDGYTDEYGFLTKKCSSYSGLSDEIGIPLLQSSLAENEEYQICSADTDNADYRRYVGLLL